LNRRADRRPGAAKIRARSATVRGLGAWGTGNFENDGALEFGGDVIASEDGADLARRQLEVACAPGKLDAAAAEAVLVAAELVAAARGAAGAGLPPPIAKWVQVEAPGFGEDDCRLALAACTRVASDSDLQASWSAETGKVEEWTAVVGELVDRLHRALGDVDPANPGGAAPARATAPWRLWEALDPATTRFVAALFERYPALAESTEIRVALSCALKSKNEFDADLALRLTITPGGDVTVEFAGLEETFSVVDGDGGEGGQSDEDDQDHVGEDGDVDVDADHTDDEDDAGNAAPAGSGAIAIGPDTLSQFLDDLMADRVCVVHRYVGDDLEQAFAVAVADVETGIRAALAAPATRRFLGRKKRPSAIVVSWTGAHDREVGGD